MDFLNFINSTTGIAASIITIIAGFTSFAFFTWRKVIEPIKKTNKLVVDGVAQIQKLNETVTKDVIPFIDSFKAEFTVNSGKSLKDQITRIDESTRLAELRSKLIATNLLTSGAFECDAIGKTVWVNKAVAEIFGLEREEMLDTGWLAAVIDSQREDVWEKWSYAIKHNIPFETEYTVYNKVQKVQYNVRATAMAHKTATGKVLGYFGTVVKA